MLSVVTTQAFGKLKWLALHYFRPSNSPALWLTCFYFKLSQGSFTVCYFCFIILFDKTVSFSFLPCSVFPQARLKPCSPSWVTNRLTAHLQSWSLRCQRSHSHKAERIDLLSHASDMKLPLGERQVLLWTFSLNLIAQVCFEKSLQLPLGPCKPQNYRLLALE